MKPTKDSPFYTDYISREVMQLHNVRLVDDDRLVNIKINGSQIADVSTANAAELNPTVGLHFEDAIAFPGLVNSHDHLDFNLFPKLGEATYVNYQEWGKTIHQNYVKEIAQTLTIPKLLRERWGIYKNLICGVTTVVNHGAKLKPTPNYINVLETAESLHSVQFEKYWKFKLNNPFNYKKDVVIHVGEGTDQLAKIEIDRLIQWNLFRRNLIGIHGVALTAHQANAFTALVWCPESNYYLLNATSNLNAFKQYVPILFGTDSTLTSNWNIWDHLNFARSLNLLTDRELYHSLNKNPAKIWRQSSHQIQAGADADLVIAKAKNNRKSLDAFFQLQPCDLLMVIAKGEILLFDHSLKSKLGNLKMEHYQQIKVADSFKYIIGNIGELIDQIKQYQPTVNFPIEIIHTN